MTIMTATRRNMLALAGGAALLGSADPAAARRKLDFAAPADHLRTYMLMRGALDDRLVIGWVNGRYYGIVDSEVKPLFGVVGATFARYRAAPGGGYEGASYEVSYFTNLDSGEAMEQYANPYTGQTVTVPLTNFPAAKIIIGVDGTLIVPHPVPGLTMKQRLRPANVSGDNVWMVEETFSSMQIPNVPAPVRYTEIITLHATLSDLENPKAMRVPCETGYQNVVSWRPWLKMGDHPGHLNANAFGAYGATLDDLPANLLQALRKYRPEVLTNTTAPIDALLKT